jgi:hypothetical protein
VKSISVESGACFQRNIRSLRTPSISTCVYVSLHSLLTLL